MENATKALLIVATVLISIVLISLGLVLLNSGNKTTDQAGTVGEGIESVSQGKVEDIQTGLGTIGNKKPAQNQGDGKVVECSSCLGTGKISKLKCSICNLYDVSFFGNGHNDECAHKENHNWCTELIDSENKSIYGFRTKYCECEIKNMFSPMCNVKCSICGSMKGTIIKVETDCLECEDGHIIEGG